MKFKGLKFTSVFVLFAVSLFNCKSSDNNSVCGGGKGGSATLLVTPEAHGIYLDTATIYIKYATQDLPADGIYDDSMKVSLVDTTPIAAFGNLKNGCYYLFAKGYHIYGNAEAYVKGGVPVTIQTQDSQAAYVPTYTYQP